MKGLVFNEFLTFVEHEGGERLLDDVIVAAELPGGGAYTSVGTYPFHEMQALVGAMHACSGLPVPDILDGFGQHCFGSWVQKRPHSFARERALFDVLEQIDTFHEVEVRKLYPDAELPSFRPELREGNRLVIGYHSPKNLPDLAIGVIKGAAAHMGVSVTIAAEPAEGADGPYTRLIIELQNAAPLPVTVLSCPISHGR